MSLPSYSRYKDSGIEWLGAVPEHWPVKRFSWVADVNPSKAEVAGLSPETLVTFLPMEAIGEDGTLALDRRKPLREVEQGYTYFRNGDVAVAKITPCFENGKGAVMRGLSNGVGFGTTELLVARPRPKEVTASYLDYLLRSSEFRRLGESYMYGAGGQKRVPESFVRNFVSAFPPISEQQLIAAFLDRETAKIDELVAEQRRLMELLKEKRQAVISHAVTRGLNPDAPMKPSGIQGLGDMPGHWEVKRLKHVSPDVTVGIVVEPSKYYVPEGVPALRSLNIMPGAVTLENLVFVSDEANTLHAKSQLRSGDLVVVRSGQPGTTAVIPPELDGCNCVDLIIIRKPTVTSEFFLCWFLASDVAVAQFSAGSGGAIQQHFNVGMAVDLWVTVPPRHEQESIVEFLDGVTSQLDALIAASSGAIGLLQERRRALISAAVTGQIDVRSIAEAQPA